MSDIVCFESRLLWQVPLAFIAWVVGAAVIMYTVNRVFDFFGWDRTNR